MPLLAVLFPGGRSVGPRAAFRLGYLHGFAFFLILLHWIPRLPPENVTVPFLMYPALLLMCFYLALFPAAWAAGTAFLCAPGGFPALLVAPSLWALLEALRALGITGFPWGSLGYSQWHALPLIQFARFGGLWSVSFWVVALNVLIFQVAFGGDAVRRRALAGVLLLVAVPWLDGRAVLARARADHARPRQPVLLVQPNTGNDKWNPVLRTEVVNSLVSMTLDAVPGTPSNTLIIWPETATPTLLRYDPTNYAEVCNVARVTGRTILTGFPDRGPYRNGQVSYYNAAGLIPPYGGLVESYDKIKLVPFSEWMPVPGLNKVNFGQSNFTPGDSLVVFRKGPVPLGVLICYESIFPAMARTLVRDGAQCLVNVTNDQWFGRSAAPWQHLTMAVFRAVENDVGIARAANTGVSCVIEPTGEITHPTGLFVPATVAADVALAGPRTFYNRHGDWILAVSAFLALAAALLRLARGRRVREGAG